MACVVTIHMKKSVDLRLSKLYFHWTLVTCSCIVFLGLGTLFCCSFFCSLDQSCKTLQTVQLAPLEDRGSTDGPQNRL